MTRASVAPPSSSATGRVGRRLVPAASSRLSRSGRCSRRPRASGSAGSASSCPTDRSPSSGIRRHRMPARSTSTIRRPSFAVLLGGEIGAGEAYMDGMWSSPDLTALLRVAALNREALALSAGWWRWPSRLRETLGHRLRRNTVAGSRRNIEAHYDLGNDFYRLFLDETMTYSSAVFASTRRVAGRCAAAQVPRHGRAGGTPPRPARPGDRDRLGGFALYAAGELGCRVTTLTISPAQHALATQRIRAAGLADLVTVELRDYRDIEGIYDAIVSIEMFEAVGAEYFATFFEACDRALRPGGRLSLQTIAFPDAAYERQLRGANWIQTYIFPGGLLPSLAAIERSLHETSLLVRRVEDIAPLVRPDAPRLAGRVLCAPRRRPGARLRRAVCPDVGLLPCDQRGRLRHRLDAGPADRPREAPRPRLGCVAGGLAPAPIRAGVRAQAPIRVAVRGLCYDRRDGDHGRPDPDDRQGQRRDPVRRLPRGHQRDPVADQPPRHRRPRDRRLRGRIARPINPGPFQFHSDPTHVRRWMADKGYLFCRRGEVREMMRPMPIPGDRPRPLGTVRRDPSRRPRVRPRLTGSRRIRTASAIITNQ